MAQNKQKARLVHIAKNLPNHILKINIEQMGKSDHYMVSFNLKMKENTENPKYHYFQNWKTANRNDIKLAIYFNPDLHGMWMEDHNEVVWQKLING